MRLITHNMLQCPKSKTFPLRLVPTEIEVIESEYNHDFILHMLPRLDWEVLRNTSSELNLGQLPESSPESDDDQYADLFRLLHKILMDTHIKNGKLISQDGSVYDIIDGIPNMLIPAMAEREANTKAKTSRAAPEGEESQASASMSGVDSDQQPMAT